MMGTKMTVAALLMLAAPAGVGAGAQAPAAGKMSGWMAGCWIEEKGAAWTEECWTAARAGIMLGSSRTGIGEKVVSWEAMQIIAHDPSTNARIAFYASPKGQSRTAFAWQPEENGGIVFYNTAHDYPQRIRYWREGASLGAEISLADGSKPMRWMYRRLG